MNSEIELDNIVEAIQRADKIVVFAHVSPDGDAIGSALGMYLALQQLKKEVDVVADECSSNSEISSKGMRFNSSNVAIS